MEIYYQARWIKGCPFNIAPFNGDWKDSLIKCGESAIIKKHKEVK